MANGKYITLPTIDLNSLFLLGLLPYSPIAPVISAKKVIRPSNAPPTNAATGMYFPKDFSRAINCNL